MSSGEVLTMFDSVRREIVTGFTDVRGDLNRLEDQVKKTNGRVTTLELAEERRKGHREAVTFALALPGVIASVVSVISVVLVLTK